MKNPLIAPEIRNLLSTGDQQTLNEFLSSIHPAEAAGIISSLSYTEVWQVLSCLPADLRAEIFSHLDEDLQVELMTILPRADVASLLSDMPHDDRADLFKKLSPEKQEAVLPALAQAEREDIRRLASYKEGTAGSVMTSDYATLSPDLTAAEAIDRLRKEAPDKETIYYAYVVDENRKLIGFVSLKDLILAPPARRIRDIMHEDVIYAKVDDDQESAARKIQKYDLIALPVINDQGALVGIITHDDALDIITQEQTEDMEKLMAIAGSHEAGTYMKTTPWEHFKNRAGWIMVLAVLGLVSGYIVQNFESVLMRFAIFASFMPMLADTGGNTGSQSATLVVRALALGEITPRDTLRVLWREFLVALPLAVLLAVFAVFRVTFVQASGADHFMLWKIAGAVACALGLQVISATLIGALLPLAAARLKYDPAVVASPALTTIVDITGLLIFFTTAKAVLGLP